MSYKTVEGLVPANASFSTRTFVPGRLIGVAINLGLTGTQVYCYENPPADLQSGNYMHYTPNVLHMVFPDRPNLVYIAVPHRIKMPVGGSFYGLLVTVSSAQVRPIIYYYEDYNS